jgi:hypothetical protein
MRSTRTAIGVVGLSLIGSLVLARTANATISSTNTANDSTNITYAFQYSSAGNFYRVYIDSDVNAGTGFATAGIGADYLVEDGFLYNYVGPGWNWHQLGAISYSNAANTASWTFARSSIGETNCSAETARVVFQVEFAGGTFDTSSAFTHNYVPCSSPLFDSVTTNDGTNVYYKMSYSGSWSLFHVFIDTDQTASTGYATGGIGADYFLENGTLYQHTGASNSWTWTNLGAVTAYNNTGSTVSWTVARSSIGETQTNETANLFYHIQINGTTAQLPVYTHVYWGGTGGGGSGPTGTIVPLYSYPTSSYWSQIISAKNSHPSVPVIAVVNPNSGPGSSVDSNYTTGIANLQSAGITVIGYVHTSYGARAIGDVEAEIDTWKSFYPSITGIFFDEMAYQTADFVSYYQSLSSYAGTKGFTYTVGNPGAATRAEYVGTVNTILVYESAGVPSSLPSWYANYPRSNFGVIPYAVPSVDTTFINNFKSTIGYMYMTDDNLPNPWDTLPSYFSTLLTDLQ